jgi:CheY-like chemotaxis protein
MSKRVLDVGNCVPDHAAIRRLLESTFQAEVVQADNSASAFAAFKTGPFDLVLVNRKLDIDYSDGLDIIKQIKADPTLAAVPCMLITNYPDQQQLAVVAGAVPGFGKKEIHTDQTKSRLAQFLAPPGQRGP